MNLKLSFFFTVYVVCVCRACQVSDCCCSDKYVHRLLQIVADLLLLFIKIKTKWLRRFCYFIRFRTKSLTTINPFWYGDSDSSCANRMASMQCLRAKKRVCSRPCDLCTNSKARSTSPGSAKRRNIIGFNSG